MERSPDLRLGLRSLNVSFVFGSFWASFGLRPLDLSLDMDVSFGFGDIWVTFGLDQSRDIRSLEVSLGLFSLVVSFGQRSLDSPLRGRSGDLSLTDSFFCGRSPNLSPARRSLDVRLSLLRLRLLPFRIGRLNFSSSDELSEWCLRRLGLSSSDVLGERLLRSSWRLVCLFLPFSELDERFLFLLMPRSAYPGWLEAFRSRPLSGRDGRLRL